MTSSPRLRFAVIGSNHAHIHGIVAAIEHGGGTLVSWHEREPALAAELARRYPGARGVEDEREILDDESIRVVLSSIVPNERAALAVRVMRHGKDFVVDKPGATSLSQLAELRRVQAEARRIWSVVYSERLESRATVRAGELVRDGAIGTVVQTIGLGPHRVHPPARPDWFWDPSRNGGIISDIGTHQADQFLFFTGSTTAAVVAAQARNVRHPAHSEFQDFGDAMVRGNHGTGYFRVDWLTPAGLPVWGDTRLTILGTDGYMEIRKNLDLGGRDGGDHLYVVDGAGVRYVDCRGVDLPYGRQIVNDVLERTETAMPQAHCFLATELALRAQAMADGGVE